MVPNNKTKGVTFIRIQCGPMQPSSLLSHMDCNKTQALGTYFVGRLGYKWRVHGSSPGYGYDLEGVLVGGEV